MFALKPVYVFSLRALTGDLSDFKNLGNHSARGYFTKSFPQRRGTGSGSYKPEKENT